VGNKFLMRLCHLKVNAIVNSKLCGRWELKIPGFLGLETIGYVIITNRENKDAI
jgi:hypothetical protein